MFLLKLFWWFDLWDFASFRCLCLLQSISNWIISIRYPRDESREYLHKHRFAEWRANSPTQVNLLLEQPWRHEMAAASLQWVFQPLRPELSGAWDHRAVADPTGRKHSGANGHPGRQAPWWDLSLHLEAQIEIRHSGDEGSGEKERLLTQFICC